MRGTLKLTLDSNFTEQDLDKYQNDPQKAIDLLLKRGKLLLDVSGVGTFNLKKKKEKDNG